ncbi:MAG: phenylalanine--tRNA ligase subunit beta [Gloeomargaritaceae cyanobacterium C42_A2020_066]|nr:phenylalanine--tRNA ligase subunit beta [Gloeomargaritaceae cyanobacterium C42_A2020_066]
MRVSLNWLRELVDFPNLSPEALAERLTVAGFEVEDIEDRRAWAAGVVVGHVLERQPHPNADKLSVCRVEVGAAEPLQIVCGAANVRTDAWVPVALVGTHLPTIDLKIKPAKLRGVESRGMICSLAELGLEKTSEGIHLFPAMSLTPGQDVRPLLGLDDVILEVSSTANRADALSMVGLAREVAALTQGTLHLPQPQAWDLPSQGLTLEIAAGRACPAYWATVIDPVGVEPSPLAVQQRLQAAGVRAINGVVDVTNWILLEWGQPLHAFDYDKLCQVAGSATPTLGVRFGRPGEALVTLDGQERALHEQVLLITANDRPVAIAGVMGGEATEVDTTTRRVVLEAALFDPVVIRRSARSLGLRTEASARYERGVNAAELARARNRALDLLVSLVQAEPTQAVLVDQRPAAQVSLTLRLSRIQQVLGQVQTEGGGRPLTAAEVEASLTCLGFDLTPAAADTWTVTVPPYRVRDIEREIDLIEEVARHFGYDRFVETLPAQSQAGGYPPSEQVRRRLVALLRGAGLTEVQHYSLGKPIHPQQVVLTNPLFSEYSALRMDLLGGLLDAFGYNLEQGNGSLCAFELGRVFCQVDGSYVESEWGAAIWGGRPWRGAWQRTTDLSWWEAKGLVEGLWEGLNLKVTYQPESTDPRFHPGRTARLLVGDIALGIFGQIHPQIAQARQWPAAVYGLEWDMKLLERAVVDLGRPAFRPYSVYPASGRDIAFYAPLEVSAAALEATMAAAAGPLLAEVAIFDEYRGESVPAGQRSLAFHLVYRASDRTLTDADVEAVHQQVRQALTQAHAVQLRS